MENNLKNDHDYTCMICSEQMFPIKRFTTGRGRVIRLKCTCGHYEDIVNKESPHDYENHDYEDSAKEFDKEM